MTPSFRMWTSRLPIFDVGPKHTEVNFKDTYRYNIAGYRLSQLLGLDNVPMSVERKVAGKPAAMTWWLDDVMLDEGDRQKKQTVGPNPSRTASQIHIMRVFDELIQNRDRNAGNLLWTADWTMWMIDHTRAFRLGKDLLKPQQLERVDRTLLGKMRTLTAAGLTDTMGTSLTKMEIEALLARRDAIVKLFDERIAQREKRPSCSRWRTDTGQAASVSSDRCRVCGPDRVRPAAVLLVYRDRLIVRLEIGHLGFEQLFSGRRGHAVRKADVGEKHRGHQPGARDGGSRDEDSMQRVGKLIAHGSRQRDRSGCQRLLDASRQRRARETAREDRAHHGDPQRRPDAA